MAPSRDFLSSCDFQNITSTVDIEMPTSFGVKSLTEAERFNPSLAEMKHMRGSRLSDSGHAHRDSFLKSTRVQRCLSATDIVAAAPAGVVQLWVSQGKLPW